MKKIGRSAAAAVLTACLSMSMAVTPVMAHGLATDASDRLFSYTHTSGTHSVEAGSQAADTQAAGSQAADTQAAERSGIASNFAAVVYGNVDVDILLSQSNTEGAEAAVEETAEDKQLTHEDTSFITPNVENKLIVHKTAGGEGKDDVKGYLYLGSKAKVLRKEDGWYKIKSGKLMGWVSENNVFVDEEADEFLDQVNPKHVTVREEKLNLYTEKDKDSDIVAELSKDMKFMLLDKDDDWIEIRFTPNVTGYVEKSGVKVKKGAVSGVRFNVIDEYKELIEKQEKIREEEAAREAAERAAQMEISYSQNGAITVSDSEFDVLARICQREAGSHYQGCLAVANVVLNRMRSSRFPNTISGVVFQPYQFCSREKLYRVTAGGPWDVCKQAARDALAGMNNVGSRVSFRAEWAIDASRYPNSVNIGDNVFF